LSEVDTSEMMIPPHQKWGEKICLGKRQVYTCVSNRRLNTGRQ
jgi:hypothetical protein